MCGEALKWVLAAVVQEGGRAQSGAENTADTLANLRSDGATKEVA